MNPKKSNIKKFFYAELFNQDCSSSFCSYMKNLKSDDKKLYEKALKLACKIEPFKNNFDVIASVPNMIMYFRKKQIILKKQPK